MSKKWGLVITLIIGLIALTGCSRTSSEMKSEPDYQEYFYSLDELRGAFEAAGGQCWDWEVLEVPAIAIDTLAQANCDSETVLKIFTEGSDVRQAAIRHRAFLENLGFGVHILFGKNWWINSSQVESVHAQMGGTLMTR